MLTDDQARDLLQRAARTIDVAPAPPLVAPRRARWVLPAAVAAAVAVLVAGGVLTGRLVEQRGPDPVSAPRTAPPVVGLLADAARARLEAAGFEVVERDRAACLPPEAAVGVEVRTPGVAVLVVNRLVEGSLTCPSGAGISLAEWGFLGMLAGGPAVTVGDAVDVSLDGAPVVVVPGDRVGDLAAWGDADRAAAVLRSTLAAPDLRAAPTAAASCRSTPAAPGVTAIHLTDGSDPCGVTLLLNSRDGVVTGLDVRTAAAPDPDAAPDLRGLGEDEARAAAAAVVDPAQVYVTYLEDGCSATGRVASQSPRPGRRLRGSLSIQVTVPAPDCDATPVTATERSAGEALIALAGGGTPPPLADEVRLFFGHAPVGTLTAAEASDPERWEGCPPTYGDGNPDRGCPTPLLSGLVPGGYDTAVRAEAVLPTCGTWLLAAALPAEVAALDSFFVSPPAAEIACASGYRLQVFLDDAGRVAAVDLARMDP